MSYGPFADSAGAGPLALRFYLHGMVAGLGFAKGCTVSIVIGSHVACHWLGCLAASAAGLKYCGLLWPGVVWFEYGEFAVFAVARGKYPGGLGLARARPVLGG